MELTVLQIELTRVLALVGRAVSPRSTLPVLSHILLVARQGRLQLAATDLELCLTGWLDAEVVQPGAITIPARTFTELVNTLPKDALRLSLNQKTQTLTVLGQGSHTQIKGLDAQEFPSLPQAEGQPSLQFPAAELKTTLRQVTLAASTDEARPALTGVLVNVQGQTVTFAAADGFRLAVRTATLPASAQDMRLLIPARALHELERALTESVADVEMLVPKEGHQVLFRTPDMELATQLIDAKFPDYEPVIPKQSRTRTVVLAADFLKACKQAEIFARDSANTARLDLMPGLEGRSGGIKVFAQADETGSNETCVEAIVEGEPLQIAFNVRYLRDALEVMQTPHVVLETSQANSPGVLRPYGDDHALHVLMPMHAG